MESLKHILQQLPVGATFEMSRSSIPKFSNQVVVRIKKDKYLISGGTNIGDDNHFPTEEEIHCLITDLILLYNRNVPL